MAPAGLFSENRIDWLHVGMQGVARSGPVVDGLLVRLQREWTVLVEISLVAPHAGGVGVELIKPCQIKAVLFFHFHPLREFLHLIVGLRLISLLNAVAEESQARSEQNAVGHQGALSVASHLPHHLDVAPSVAKAEREGHHAPRLLLNGKCSSNELCVGNAGFDLHTNNAPPFRNVARLIAVAIVFAVAAVDGRKDAIGENVRLVDGKAVPPDPSVSLLAEIGHSGKRGDVFLVDLCRRPKLILRHLLAEIFMAAALKTQHARHITRENVAALGGQRVPHINAGTEGGGPQAVALRESEDAGHHAVGIDAVASACRGDGNGFVPVCLRCDGEGRGKGVDFSRCLPPSGGRGRRVYQAQQNAQKNPQTFPLQNRRDKGAPTEKDMSGDELAHLWTF